MRRDLGWGEGIVSEILTNLGDWSEVLLHLDKLLENKFNNEYDDSSKVPEIN